MIHHRHAQDRNLKIPLRLNIKTFIIKRFLLNLPVSRFLSDKGVVSKICPSVTFWRHGWMSVKGISHLGHGNSNSSIALQATWPVSVSPLHFKEMYYLRKCFILESTSLLIQSNKRCIFQPLAAFYFSSRLGCNICMWRTTGYFDEGPSFFFFFFSTFRDTTSLDFFLRKPQFPTMLMATKTRYFSRDDGTPPVECVPTRLDIWKEVKTSLGCLAWYFWREVWTISSHVCGNQSKCFKPKHNLFLTTTKCFVFLFFLCLNLIRSKVLSHRVENWT